MIDWIDFLDLAEILAAEPNNDAAARTAITRAYDAAFHAGREFLVRSGIPLNQGRNAHHQVREELTDKVETIGRDLGRLHTWRKHADHDSRTETIGFDTSRLATFAMSLSRQTIESIAAIQ